MIVSVLSQVYFLFFLLSASFVGIAWSFSDYWMAAGSAYSALMLFFLSVVLSLINRYSRYIVQYNLTNWSITFVFLAITLPLLLSGPFLTSGYYDSWVTALFDSVSSVTSTGATSLPDNIAVQQTDLILLWRALISWISAVVSTLFVVVSLSYLVTYNGFLYRLLHINETRDVWYIAKYCRSFLAFYVILTIAGVAALAVSGHTWIDSIRFSLQSISTTGGIAGNTANLGLFSKLIMGVLMIIGATNITIHWTVAEYFVNKSSQSINLYWQDKEFKTMMKVIIISVLFICLTDYQHVSYLLSSTLSYIVDRLFVVISIFTTTGWYVETTGSFLWLGLLLLVGGSIASTAGGLKIIRFLVLFKFSINELNHVVSPYTAREIVYGRFRLTYQDIFSIGAFFMIFIFFYMLCLIVLSVIQPDLSLSQVFFFVLNAGTNGGESMRYLCSDCGYSVLNDGGKFLIMATMVLGRLELLTLYGIAHRLILTSKS